MLSSPKWIVIFLFPSLLNFDKVLANDSTRSIYITAGSYNFLFNQEVATTVSRTAFFYTSFSPAQNIAAGGKLNIRLTEKKNISLGLLYSHASLGYHYSPPYSNNRSFKTTGYIGMDGLILTTDFQYRLFKWLKVNYGMGHHFNLSNSFDSAAIAENIGWNNNGKSKMKTYTIALSFGMELKLYKRLSLELNLNRGLNKFIVLNLKSDPEESFPLRWNFTGLTLNYRIN